MTPTINELAQQIYSIHFGHLDDKYFRDAKTTEIADWLANGDIAGCTLDDLALYWFEYDEDAIKAAQQ